MNYKTPNVYIEEVSTLPPSVAEVSTAIPAFIGYTEIAVKDGNDLTNIPVRIKNFIEFKSLFGGAQKAGFKVDVTEYDDGNGNVTGSEINSVTISKSLSYLLYHSLDIYFKNGGGSCYIISVGTYQQDGSKVKSGFETGLAALAKKDEPTLIVLSDAVSLGADDYYALCSAALTQCSQLGDRFALFDVLTSDNEDINADADSFRSKISGDLKYGAAYYPYLQTSLNYHFDDTDVEITGIDGEVQEVYYTQNGSLKVNYEGEATSPKVKILVGSAGDNISFAIDDTDPEAPLLTINNIKDDTENKHTGSKVVTDWESWLQNNDNKGFSLAVDGDGSTQAINIAATSLSKVVANKTLSSLKTDKTALYYDIQTALAGQRIVLPPASAMAGVYARIDREQGVWKAPANVSLSSVSYPVVKIGNDDQEGLNVHAEAGKSINAIRSFAGIGNLVWGARTLAGNDNEWKYVAVRRLFLIIEESVKKATRFAVFESNNQSTWLKVKSVITNYLTGLWKEGALTGPTAEAAFFVRVGLDETMTAQDMLEGKINIEIGLAAVRPAEFIVLRFSHKMQET